MVEPNPSGEGLGQFTDRSDHERQKALVTTPGWFLLQLFFCRVRTLSRREPRLFFESRPATPGESAYAPIERREIWLARSASFADGFDLQTGVSSERHRVSRVGSRGRCRASGGAGFRKEEPRGEFLTACRRSSFVVRRSSSFFLVVRGGWGGHHAAHGYRIVVLFVSRERVTLARCARGCGGAGNLRRVSTQCSGP